eukprot:142-Hanusia_phi.AAC.1
MEPLAYDRGQELAMLQRKDKQLLAQRAALEKTTHSLIEQKNELLQHYKETEHVGMKLQAYKDKLKKDAEEVKNAEEAAEILMQRLAKAQGDTIAAQTKLQAEKQKLETAKKELGKVEEQEKQLKRTQRTDRLVRALESDGSNLSSEERAELCHDCTCTLLLKQDDVKEGNVRREHAVEPVNALALLPHGALELLSPRFHLLHRAPPRLYSSQMSLLTPSSHRVVLLVGTQQAVTQQLVFLLHPRPPRPANVSALLSVLAAAHDDVNLGLAGLELVLPPSSLTSLLPPPIRLTGSGWP